MPTTTLVRTTTRNKKLLRALKAPLSVSPRVIRKGQKQRVSTGFITRTSIKRIIRFMTSLIQAGTSINTPISIRNMRLRKADLRKVDMKMGLIKLESKELKDLLITGNMWARIVGLKANKGRRDIIRTFRSMPRKGSSSKERNKGFIRRMFYKRCSEWGIGSETSFMAVIIYFVFVNLLHNKAL